MLYQYYCNRTALCEMVTNWCKYYLLAAITDVIFTSERCNRVTYGLRTVNGDPTRYKQCGPSGRVWIVPCAPQMTFDPEDRVCKERLDSRTAHKPMRKYETPPKTIITTPAPIPSSYPVSAEVTPASAPVAAPEEFVFSTIRPKSRKPKARTRGKLRKTTTVMSTTPSTTPMSMEIQKSSGEDEMTTTPRIVIFASKKNSLGGNKSEEMRNQNQSVQKGRGVSAAFTRPGRIRTTTPMPVTHATRFVPGIQKITVAPKENQGMPHTLAPYEKTERRGESFETGESMTTMTPEYTVRYNGQTMTENEFLNQLLHIVQHQKSVSERQQQDKFERMEQERIRQEKEEKLREMERRRQLAEAEKARQAEIDRQAAIYAEQERMAMERERELERIQQEERKREMERIRQEEIAMEILRMRELEQLQMERQQKNERVRQELEAARKQKILEEERQRKIKEQMREMEKIRKEQEEAREIEMRRLEEERAREMERVREEEMERQQQIERLRQQEEERKRKKLEMEKEERKKALIEEERKRKVLEKELEERRQAILEEERKRKILEKEMEERQTAIYEEHQRRKAEEERRKQKEMEERKQIQEQMRKASEERSRLEAMERERELMRQIIENENKQQEFEATTQITTIKPIYRPDISEYQPPDVESHMIRFTTQSPEWATPSPATWNPSWNTVTVEEETPEVSLVMRSQCQINGECELKYDADSFCAHPVTPSMYLQCAPLYGRLGRWTERHCPDTLIFIVSIGRCEKGEESRKPYDPDNRVVIPRLPSETSFVEWKGNRVIDHHIPSPISPPRVYPPVPEPHQPQIYNTIDEFPKDLLPKLPEVSPADTYAQQYQNHIHGSVISGGYPRPAAPNPTVSPVPIIPSSYQITRVPNVQVMNQVPSNSIKSEIDLSHIHPLFPRVQPDFLSRILPSLNLKMHDEHRETQSLGSVVKPVLKKIALNQTEQFLDRLLADQVQDEKVRKEIIDRLKSSNIDELKKLVA
ncbi:hypothetical protein L5515_003495 [Caenorhabditis briggsae]|uniref:Chitin-binding type-2 domain-containing protein n=1 Tax=Caenorhabditis briggsae TaxID=6238 RepID=A0AAE9EHZ0_CAEBR|nr:hypothetical protein L5515_003495 [Caenorhabditis briggsae]